MPSPTQAEVEALVRAARAARDWLSKIYGDEDEMTEALTASLSPFQETPDAG